MERSWKSTCVWTLDEWSGLHVIIGSRRGREGHAQADTHTHTHAHTHTQTGDQCERHSRADDKRWTGRGYKRRRERGSKDVSESLIRWEVTRLTFAFHILPSTRGGGPSGPRKGKWIMGPSLYTYWICSTPVPSLSMPCGHTWSGRILPSV